MHCFGVRKSSGAWPRTHSLSRLPHTLTHHSNTHTTITHTQACRLRVQPLMRFLCCPQKIFGAEMRSVPPGDLSLGDGDAGPRPGLPPQLLHVHHLQQDAHHRGPLWHEGQSGVLSAAL